ncbi:MULTISPECIES: class I SAM-dependent methyltransferase [Stenotrophomonas]|uniref:class I SAM-dependent methyltransferase n=1 Tax=Stenotrophomonas TaxID=40323 RepID=UPI000C9B03E5|nr:MULTISPECIES: methyltransferase domain-containing protein [Stenotrophomonas]MDX5516411.1 class I SAM-dependent methyltransferase [Stenotrophomonas sp. RG-453]
MYPQSTWFDTVDALTDAVADSLGTMRVIDAGIAAGAAIDGYCVHCERVCLLQVNGGALFGEDVNLREGLVCQSCGLNSRSRQLYLAARRAFPHGSRLALLEAFSPLARYAEAAWPGIQLSEFHDSSARSGQTYEFPDNEGGHRRAFHQDMQRMSFADQSLDGILHNDVLEHVPDALAGLQECHRVLVDGGTALFTMPWFPWLPSTLVRGRLDEQGALLELLPTELHGDGLRPEGIYTFYNFGADFADLLGRAGFSKIAFGCCYDPFAGFVTNNYRYGDDFLMLPTVIRATKAA